jgi:hypothetical protein
VGELVAVLEAHKALPAPSAARETYPASPWCRALDEYLDRSLKVAVDLRLHGPGGMRRTSIEFDGGRQDAACQEIAGERIRGLRTVRCAWAWPTSCGERR